MFAWKSKPRLADQLTAITKKTCDDITAKINAVTENAKKVCVIRLQETAAVSVLSRGILCFNDESFRKSIEGFTQLTVGETETVVANVTTYLISEGMTVTNEGNSRLLVVWPSPPVTPVTTPTETSPQSGVSAVVTTGDRFGMQIGNSAMSTGVNIATARDYQIAIGNSALGVNFNDATKNVVIGSGPQ